MITDTCNLANKNIISNTKHSQPNRHPPMTQCISSQENMPSENHNNTPAKNKKTYSIHNAVSSLADTFKKLIRGCITIILPLPTSTNTFFQITHTRMHAHTQPFYGSLDFVWENMGETVPETVTYSCLSWSSIIPYLLPPSVMIHGILPVQFMCLTAFFHNLSPSFLWSTSWPGTLHFILHTLLQPIIV